MVRKIPTDTRSFQTVLLPLQPDKFPDQMDERTCWQIGWATNCTYKDIHYQSNTYYTPLVSLYFSMYFLNYICIQQDNDLTSLEWVSNEKQDKLKLMALTLIELV